MTDRQRIYLDYAAATPVCAEAQDAYADAVVRFPGNPSGLHQEGVLAKGALTEARRTLARPLQCKEGQLIFTSGGTEGNNLAITGSISALADAGVPYSDIHIVVSALEHPSVIEPVLALEKQGVQVSLIEPDDKGEIRPDALVKLLTPQTRFVSIGWANSEIGVIQPLGDLSDCIRAYEKATATKIVFHSDAGQAPLYHRGIPQGLGVDLLTLDSGKLYGPKLFEQLEIVIGSP